MIRRVSLQMQVTLLPICSKEFINGKWRNQRVDCAGRIHLSSSIEIRPEDGTQTPFGLSMFSKIVSHTTASLSISSSLWIRYIGIEFANWVRVLNSLA